MWSVIFTKGGAADLDWFRRHDRRAYMKCFDLVRDMMLDPRSGIGKPEPLGHEDEDVWSRRIDKKHRLIYSIIDHEQGIVVSAFRSHYGDH